MILAGVALRAPPARWTIDFLEPQCLFIMNKVFVELSLSNKIRCPHFCFPIWLKNFLHTKSFPKFCFKRIFISIFKIELNGSAPNIVTAAQPFSNRIIEILFCGIECLTTLVELFSLDGGGTCQKCFSIFFGFPGQPVPENRMLPSWANPWAKSSPMTPQS